MLDLLLLPEETILSSFVIKEGEREREKINNEKIRRDAINKKVQR